MVRIGLALSDEGYARLQHLTKSITSVKGQAALVESLLFGMDDAEIEKICDAGRIKRDAAMAAVRELRKKARNAVNGLTPEQLERLLQMTEEKPVQESHEPQEPQEA